MKAVLRLDLLEAREFPPTHPSIEDKDFENLAFKCMLFDEADPYSITEKDSVDGYNMIILHPITNVLHWCYCNDFAFRP